MNEAMPATAALLEGFVLALEESYGPSLSAGSPSSPCPAFLAVEGQAAVYLPFRSSELFFSTVSTFIFHSLRSCGCCRCCCCCCVGLRLEADTVGAGNGILALGWPSLSPETTAAATKPTEAATREARQVGGSWEGRRLLLVTVVPVVAVVVVVASAAAKAKLDEELRRGEKDLDPRRTHYLLNQANPRESEREDEEDVKEQEQEDGQGSLHGGQGFQLHSIFNQRQQQQQTAALLSYFSSSSAATASSSEYARLSEHSLGYHQFGLQQQQPPPQQQRPHSSRYGLRGSGGGEIVEVQGGHIVRSTGRKDRHSKVCTAKGPRDRRVRLAAHTAIQFYDVQDRLGYDRPSKAVDWLIKNAKASIDELAELPAWTPTATGGAAVATASSSRAPPQLLNHSPEQSIGESNQKAIQVVEPVVSAGFSFTSGGDIRTGDDTGSASFLPPSLDSDSIADTIKSFFPMAAAAATSTSSSPTIGFQTYQQDLLSRTPSHNQDLRLSLQSFQDPPVFHNPHSSHQSSAPPAHNALFAGSPHLSFDAASASWAEQSQRMVPWNVADASGGGSGYVFSLPPTPPQQAVPLHSVLGQGQLFSQRGPLQSSNSPSVRAWAVDPAIADHQMHSALHPAMSTIGFASGAGFSGFRIPARIQGEEEHDGVTNKPPSASSASRH